MSSERPSLTWYSMFVASAKRSRQPSMQPSVRSTMTRSLAEVLQVLGPAAEARRDLEDRRRSGTNAWMRGSSAPYQSAGVPPHHADHSSPARATSPSRRSRLARFCVDVGHRSRAATRRPRLSRRARGDSPWHGCPRARAPAREPTGPAFALPHRPARHPRARRRGTATRHHIRMLPARLEALSARPAASAPAAACSTTAAPTCRTGASSRPTPTTSPPTCPATRTRRSCSTPTAPSRRRTRASTRCCRPRCSSTSTDPALYLSECFRVLRPGGRMLLSTHGMFVYHPDPDDYWRWTCAGLQHVVERGGLRGRALRGHHRAAADRPPARPGRHLLPPAARRCGRVFALVMQTLVALADRLPGPGTPGPQRAGVRAGRREAVMLDVACAAEGDYVAHSAAMLHSVLGAQPAGTSVHVHYLHGPDLAASRASRSREMVERDGAAQISFLRDPRRARRGAAHGRLHPQGDLVPDLPARAAARRRPGPLPGRRPDRGGLARAAVGDRPRRPLARRR